MTRKFLAVQAITLSRLPLSIAFATVLLQNEPTPQTIGICLVLLVLAELTDAFDGFFARRWGQESEFGAMIDPLIDSVSRLMVFWALSTAGFALSVVLLVMAIRDVVVANCRIVWVKHGESVSARLSGKLKAMVQAGGAFLLTTMPVLALSDATVTLTSALASWTVAVVTALSGIDYCLQTAKLVRNTRQDVS